ncbi:variable surface protein [Plasmodium gonderi]|uniref:Variable surface protein n=1 Tax=Plasmodium gonderi TaxID=77519 RepID=A0A1Y1JUM6_PLAGO|nr:variable surface protein [Plasmodium gonderi]GAW84452.1 variable surface protein [Plasmodium gonderi]
MSAHFNFMNIFPTCLDQYNNHTKNLPGEDNLKLQQPCMTITNIFNFLQSKESFMPKCEELIIYLDYINSISTTSDIEPCCKYFNYKLKQILNFQKNYTEGTKVAYRRMTTITNSITYKNFPDICKNHVDDIDEKTFKILETLDNLYSILKRDGNKCPSETECYEKFMELSKICDTLNNDSLHDLLSNFKKENIKIIEDTKNMVQVNSKQEVHAVSHHTSGINPRTIILVLFTISFTTLMITFFLYKYTPSVSFLHSIACIIRRMCKRKDKQNIKLLISFENDNEELVNESSQISYNAIQYF